MTSEDFDPKQFALLADFSEEDCEALSELLEPQKLARGRKLFREGGESEGLVLLASGAVEVSARRSERPVQRGAGAVFGALAMLTVGAREATASTIEPCEVWRLPREGWRRLVEDAPRTACRLAEAIMADAAGMIREALDAFDERGPAAGRE